MFSVLSAGVKADTSVCICKHESMVAIRQSQNYIKMFRFYPHVYFNFTFTPNLT